MKISIVLRKREKMMYLWLEMRQSQALAPIITSLYPCHLPLICVAVSIIAGGVGGAGGVGVLLGGYSLL